MKLRANVTIDTDCRGQVEADEFEKRIEALVAELGQEFVEVQYGIKVRRAPKQNSTPLPRRYAKVSAGNVTCYAYDALHRLTAVTYPSGSYAAVTPQKHFVYDSATVNGQSMNNA